MLEIRDLSLHYGQHLALDRVSVTVGKGEVTLGEEADGTELDVPAAVAAIQQAAAVGAPEQRQVALPMKAISPAIHTDQVRPVSMSFT